MRMILWERNLTAEKFPSYLRNLEEENSAMRNALREISATIPFQVRRCGNLSILSLSMPHGDYKVLQRRALEHANKESSFVIFSLGNVVAMAFPERFEFSRSAFLSLIGEMGGRGGGKGNFLSGSVGEPADFLSRLENIICEKIIGLHGDSNGYD
jgi:alanyl-tRNA synthetase